MNDEEQTIEQPLAPPEPKPTTETELPTIEWDDNAGWESFQWAGPEEVNQ